MKTLTTTIALALILTGCSGQSTTSAPIPIPAPTTPGSTGANNHPSEGPHQGDLIELGDEQYHAELVHQDGNEQGITVYILDGAAKTEVTIDATEVTLNLSHDGQPEQFQLAALPTENNPEGKSSRFSSPDKDLLEHFNDDAVEGTLVVTIDGKSFRGTIAHDHDHSSH